LGDFFKIDVKEISSLPLLKIAAIIIFLSGGYFLVKRAVHRRGSEEAGK
jgi:hypothetical protein